MTAGPTPGPWAYRPHDDDDWGFVRAPNNNLVCVVKSDFYLSEEEKWAHRRANTDPCEGTARLIAAAPDLLAALKAMIPDTWADDDTMDFMPGMKLARAAIAKAEGKAP